VGEDRRPYRGFIDVVLAAEAMSLARKAQSVRTTALPQVVDRLQRRGWVGTDDTARALVAATRAGSRGERWFGWLNTCLTRSLVAGSLLTRLCEVELHVGFRPGDGEEAVDGHAWLEVDGNPVGETAGGGDAQPYDSVVRIPFGPAGREDA
jgi:hypothetical protein